ncbi:hypothetical protein E8E13_004780 [Curvularia kusanoi]|uniref:RTA1-domain-containing protein n=1 Tax=Curvularia kusanoi TaxID=90978 RepID=A0A9P4W4X3_CURKU|nr:hypothetical protein E8E13_004780 [Curvularia kusanoi]
MHFLLTRTVDRNGIDPQHLNTTTTDPVIIAMSRKYCTVGTCPPSWQVIEYRPSVAGNSIYLTFFTLLLLAQLALGWRYRSHGVWKYTAIMSVGVLGEMVGYVGRILLYQNPFLMNNFFVNLIPLTLSPALLTAAIYISLYRVIVATDASSSRLRPAHYTLVFVLCDLLALVLQAIGGGLAATAKDKRGSDVGVKIMIAGLISQVLSMAGFVALWADFQYTVLRAKKTGGLKWVQPPLYEELRGEKRWKGFRWSLFAATLLIFVRCVYRVAELWDGFGGHLANHEASFMVFEGPLIILAVAAMTLFHPGRVFGALWGPAGRGERTGVRVRGQGSEVGLNETYPYEGV